MDVDTDRLIQALASRLAAIVPEGFHVEASDGMLWYSAPAGRHLARRVVRSAHASFLRILSVSDHEDERGGHGRPAS